MTRHYYATLTEEAWPRDHVYIFAFESAHQRHLLADNYKNAARITCEDAEKISTPDHWYHVDREINVTHADGTPIDIYEYIKFIELTTD